MNDVTKVKLSQISLYFGLIKTTIANEYLDTHFFVQLLNDLLLFQTLVFLSNKKDKWKSFV